VLASPPHWSQPLSLARGENVRAARSQVSHQAGLRRDVDAALIRVYSTLATFDKLCQRAAVHLSQSLRRGFLTLVLVGAVAEPAHAQAPSRAESVPAPVAPSSSSGVALPEVDYQPEVYPPPSARWRTLLAGAAIAGAGYGLGLGSSYVWEGAPGMDGLRKPVIGAVYAIKDAGCGASEGAGCSAVTVGFRSVIAVLSGLAQVGGIALLVEGIVMKTSDTPTQTSTSRSFYALPTATESGVGLQVGGSF
jgi:hypothetical protein